MVVLWISFDMLGTKKLIFDRVLAMRWDSHGLIDGTKFGHVLLLQAVSMRLFFCM